MLEKGNHRILQRHIAQAYVWQCAYSLNQANVRIQCLGKVCGDMLRVHEPQYKIMYHTFRSVEIDNELQLIS